MPLRVRNKNSASSFALFSINNIGLFGGWKTNKSGLFAVISIGSLQAACSGCDIQSIQHSISDVENGNLPNRSVAS